MVGASGYRNGCHSGPNQSKQPEDKFRNNLRGFIYSAPPPPVNFQTLPQQQKWNEQNQNKRIEKKKKKKKMMMKTKKKKQANTIVLWQFEYWNEHLKTEGK